MSIAVELGCFTLVLKEKAASCRVVLSISFLRASFGVEVIPEDLIQHIRTNSSWVTCNRSFQLKISIAIEDGDADDGNTSDDNWSTLALALIQAEIWARLNLQASLLELRHSPGGAGVSLTNMTISLEHVAHESFLSNPRYHRLPVPEGVSNVVPPPSMPKYLVDSITLSLSVTRTQNSNLQPLSSYDVKGRLESQDQSTARIDVQDRRKEQLGIEELTIFLDASLRCSISRNLGRLKKGFRLSHDHRIVTLSEIAPVLWRPGYVEAVAERVPLLATINQCLANIHVDRSNLPSGHAGSNDTYHRLWSTMKANMLHTNNQRTPSLGPIMSENSSIPAATHAHEEMLHYDTLPFEAHLQSTHVHSLQRSSSPLAADMMEIGERNDSDDILSEGERILVASLLGNTSSFSSKLSETSSELREMSISDSTSPFPTTSELIKYEAHDGGLSPLMHEDRMSESSLLVGDETQLHDHVPELKVGADSFNSCDIFCLDDIDER